MITFFKNFADMEKYNCNRVDVLAFMFDNQTLVC